MRKTKQAIGVVALRDRNIIKLLEEKQKLAGDKTLSGTTIKILNRYFHIEHILRELGTDLDQSVYVPVQKVDQLNQVLCLKKIPVIGIVNANDVAVRPDPVGGQLTSQG